MSGNVIFDGSDDLGPDNGHDMNEASLEAFEKKLENGSVDTDEEKVYELIRDLGPITSKELLQFMDKSATSQFSGRITKLKEKDVVESAGMENGENLWKVKE